MAIILEAPSCLHVPAMGRGGTAVANWADLVGYEVDRRFEPTDLGETWRTVEARELIWLDVTDILDWRQIEGAFGDKYTNIYRGRGTASDTAYEPGVSHISHQTDVPGDAEKAYFRVRAFCGGDYSPYTYADAIPVFTLDSNMTLPVTAGEKYLVQVDARDMPVFKDTVLSLEYDRRLLRLEDAYLEVPGQKTDMTCGSYENIIQEIAHTDGKYEFKCLKEIATETGWSGLVVCFRFVAAQSGAATFTLS